MSIAALNWAMDQKTDGPSAQSVLFVIADRASEHGVSRHADPDTIAQKTRQSRATVFRRLEEAERVGLLTRFTRHLDDGRREYEVRLAMKKYVNYRVDKTRTITIYAMDDEKCEGEPIQVLPFDGEPTQDIEPQSQIETHGESQIETQPVAPVRPDESQSCDSQEGPSKSPSKKDSPLPPKGGQTEQSGNGNQETELAKIAGWAKFEKAWQEPILRQSIGRQVWWALTESEETTAITAARGYVAWRKTQKKPPNVINAHTFLRERDAWPRYAELAGPDPASRTFIAADSKEFAGIHVMATIIGAPAPAVEFDQSQGAVGYWRWQPVPPDLVGLSVFVDQPSEQWMQIEIDGIQFKAWASRINEWIDFWPRKALRVPCQFPPRKDGSIAPSSIPLATQDDLNQFGKTG